MTELEITISNLKEVISAAVSFSIKLEAAQKDLETSPRHIWETGDVLRSEYGTLMICINDTSQKPGRLRVYCAEHTGCDGNHPTTTLLESAEFLFNIKEKL